MCLVIIESLTPVATAVGRRLASASVAVLMRAMTMKVIVAVTVRD